MQVAVNSPRRDYDIIIVGAGVVGAMVARFLSRYVLDILWIEKEADICTGATSANSAVIHGGYDAIPGSLKAEMNVPGNAMWDRLAASSTSASTAAARTSSRSATRSGKHWRNRQRAVALMACLSRSSPARRCAAVNRSSRRIPAAPSYCPTGGICDPWGATIAAAENAVMNGVTLLRSTRFEDFLWADPAAWHGISPGSGRTAEISGPVG